MLNGGKKANRMLRKEETDLSVETEDRTAAVRSGCAADITVSDQRQGLSARDQQPAPRAELTFSGRRLESGRRAARTGEPGPGRRERQVETPREDEVGRILVCRDELAASGGRDRGRRADALEGNARAMFPRPPNPWLAVRGVRLALEMPKRFCRWGLRLFRPGWMGSPRRA